MNFIHRFRITTENKNKKSDILFDFIIAVVGALIFNGFIVNSHKADYSQMYFMIIKYPVSGLIMREIYANFFISNKQCK